MRKLITTAALATVALAGLAGCADNSVKPSSSASASTATTTAADQTKQVCTEATTTSTTAAAAVQAKITEAVAANGDQTKLVQIGTDLAKLATDWSSKLTELSAKPISPALKTALTDGATTITGLANPATIQSTTPAQVQTQLQAISTKIAAACAAA